LYKIDNQGFDTLTGTVGFLISAGGFLVMMTSFMAHLKMCASKWKANHKLAQLERKVEEQDNISGKGHSKVKKRAINWETLQFD